MGLVCSILFLLISHLLSPVYVLCSNNHVYRWAGITLSATADYKPTADGIKDAYIIRDDFVQAIAIDPYDASGKFSIIMLKCFIYNPLFFHKFVHACRSFPFSALSVTL